MSPPSEPSSPAFSDCLILKMGGPPLNFPHIATSQDSLIFLNTPFIMSDFINRDISVRYYSDEAVFVGFAVISMEILLP